MKATTPPSAPEACGADAPVLDEALAAIEAGFSVVPIRPDGSRGPAVPAWTPYREKAMTHDEARRLFSPGVGIALVGGFGGLECLDLETERAARAFLAAVEEEGDAAAVESIRRMPWTRCPDGGLHLIYRCDHPARPTHLAYDETGELLVETLGTGCLVTEAPSPAGCHPSGKPYVRKRGSIADVPWISMETRDRLITIARSLNRYVPAAPPSVRPQKAGKPRRGAEEGARIGDVVNREYDAFGGLEGAGWTIHSRTAEGHILLTRPDKDRKDGPSATFGLGERGDLLVVHSTNAAPFMAGQPYNPFGVFAMLECGGDYALAARRAQEIFGGGKQVARPDVVMSGEAAPASNVAAEAASEKEEILDDYIDWDVLSEDCGELADPVRHNKEPAPAKTKTYEAAKRLIQSTYNAGGWRMGDDDDLEAVPVVSWLVDGWLPVEGLACVYGPPASCKSFQGLSIALSVVTGRDWHGHRVKQGGVVYVEGESPRGLKVRRRAWCLRHGVAPEALKGRFRWIQGATPTINAEGEIERLIEECKALPEPPMLIVVDTLSATYQGSQDHSDVMADYVRRLSKMRDTLGCAVLVVHHSLKSDDGVERGSSALRGGMDVMIPVSRQEDTVTVGGAGAKCKEAKEPEPLVLCASRQETEYRDEYGRPLDSLVFAPAPADPFAEPGVTLKGKPGDVLEAIRGAGPEGIVWADLRAQGFAEVTLSRARKKLTKNGLIVQGGDERYRMAPPPQLPGFEAS